MATEKALLTADDLFRLPDDHMRHELVRGELRTMPPAGAEHGWIASEIGSMVRDFVRAHNLGWVFAAETGFHIFGDPDTVRAPDVAFVASGRFPGGRLPRNFARLAPDLVVEVVSPGDTRSEVEEKVGDWLEGGARLVWVVRPAARTVNVSSPSTRPVLLTEGDGVDGRDVLPGFVQPVRRLLGD